MVSMSSSITTGTGAGSSSASVASGDDAVVVRMQERFADCGAIDFEHLDANASLKPSTITRSTGLSFFQHIVKRRLRLAFFISWTMAQRRLDTTATSLAPARRCSQESLPG